LLTDPTNCGACAWDCGPDSACEAGICDAVEVDVPGATGLAVLGEDILVVIASACDAASTPILSYPVLFPVGALPSQTMSTVDACGLEWSVGTSHAYYAPQQGNVLTACTATACTNATLDIGAQQINGSAPVGSDLVLNTVYPTELRRSVLIGGVPGPAGTLLATVADNGVGGQHIIYDAMTDALWWTALEGCLYRQIYAALDGGVEPCFAFPGRSTCALALAPNGGVFAIVDADTQACQGGATAGYELHAVDAAGATALFGPSNVTTQLAADSDSVYAGNPNGGLYALDIATGAVVATFLHPSNARDIDARHPDYLVYSLPDKIARRRKPPPPR
jgi:hypothetical protein